MNNFKLNKEVSDIIEKITKPKDRSPLQVDSDDGYYDKEKARIAMAGDSELGENCTDKYNRNKEDVMKKVDESPNFGTEIDQKDLKDSNSSDKQLPKELDDYNSDMLGENYASKEPNSAVGQRRDIELPKSVDVVRDASRYGNGYRLLITFPNTRPNFYPPVGEDSALTKEDLVKACPVEYITHCIDAIDLAFKTAKDLNPNFRDSDKVEKKIKTPSVVLGKRS